MTSLAWSPRATWSRSRPCRSGGANEASQAVRRERQAVDGDAKGCEGIGDGVGDGGCSADCSVFADAFQAEGVDGGRKLLGQVDLDVGDVSRGRQQVVHEA